MTPEAKERSRVKTMRPKNLTCHKTAYLDEQTCRLAIAGSAIWKAPRFCSLCAAWHKSRV